MVCNTLINGDCLIKSEQIESGSVDLILTDLPYGNMKNAPSTWDKETLTWDLAIEPIKIYEIANRILRKNGKMVLFSQEPYTSRMIIEALPNIPFSYRAIWEKDNFANALLCNKAMVGYFEDILVFSKNYETNQIHPLRSYAEKVHNYIGLDKNTIMQSLSMVKIRFLRYSDTQFSLCPLDTYDKLISLYKINEMEGFKNYDILKIIDTEYKQQYPSTFNLWQGNKYKSNILKYKKDYNGFHPTQKPILLLEDLIKTFSNENNLVVDLTMGSGSTGVACINTNRNFFGIELGKDYFDISVKRIDEAKKNIQSELFQL